jgi:multidrug resistance protein, MATE family
MMFSSKLRSEFSESLKLAIPLAGSQIAQAATGFIDTVMTGWIGQEALAAGGLGAATMMLCWVGALGLVTGVTPLVAEAHGAKNSARIQQLTAQGLWLSLLVALPVMLLLSQGEGILRRTGQTATIAAMAQSYLDMTLWGFFPAIAFVLLRTVVAALGHPRSPMVIALIGLGFNATANYVLGFGKLGFPAMGLRGIATASMLTYWGVFLGLVAYIWMSRSLKPQRLFAQVDRVVPKVLQEIFQLGFPIGIAFVAEVGLYSVTTYLMGRLGTEVLAAHQMVFQTIALVFMIPLGMAYATTIRVGQWLGQANMAGVRRAAWVGITSGGLFMTLMAILILSFPQQVAGLFLDLTQPQNQALMPIFTAMITIAALSQIMDGTQATTAGALRGLKDTKVPMLLSFTSFWLVGLTLGYTLGFRLGWGGVGLWIGQAIGVATSACLFVLRFRYLTQRQSSANNGDLLKTLP